MDTRQGDREYVPFDVRCFVFRTLDPVLGSPSCPADVKFCGWTSTVNATHTVR